jgi:hypothetical protein
MSARPASQPKTTRATKGAKITPNNPINVSMHNHEATGDEDRPDNNFTSSATRNHADSGRS